MSSRPLSRPYGETHVRVLSPGRVDAPPSLELTFAGATVLFNCGEGTQRMCMDHGVRVKRFTHVALTGLTWEHVGGLPGMILTLADAGLSSIHLAGPSRLGHLLDATRFFVQRNFLDLVCHQAAPHPDGHSIPVHAADPDLAPLILTAITVRPHADPDAHAGTEPAPDLPPTPDAPPLSADYVIRAAVMKRKREKSSAAAPLPAADDDDEPEDTKRVKLLAHPEAAASSSSAGASSAASSSSPPHPDPPSLYPIADAVIESITADPSKRFFPSMSTTHSLPLLEEATSYIATYPDIVGKFDPKRAQALGVPPGPLFRTLQLGQPVTSTSGDTVHPADVTGPPTPGPRIAVLACPSLAYLAGLAASRPLAAAAAAGLTAAYHLAPPAVFESPAYAAFAASLDARHHIVLHRDYADQEYTFTSAASTALRLHALAPTVYVAPWRGAAAAPPPPAPTTVPRPGHTLILTPAKRAGVVPLAPLVPLDAAAIAADVAARTAALGPPPAIPPAAPDTLRVVFLGTGAALPSKHRNVSGTLIVGPTAPFVLDCGEGTFGQLARTFGGPAAATATVDALAFIFVSHMHADHHLGLAGLLAARSPGAPPLLVIGPPTLNVWLTELAAVQPALAWAFVDIRALEAGKRVGAADAAALGAAFTAASVDSITAVPVDHCYQSYGVVVRGCDDAWSVAFSGDCRPSADLAAAGTGVSLLVHEATFEDGMEHEAVAKKHATTGEAVGVGADMAATAVVLNHFSQRYPKVPALAPGQTVALAFDLMDLPVSAVDAVAALVPWLVAVFDAVADDDDTDP